MDWPGSSPIRRRWRRAVAQITTQQAVVSALEPEPCWRQLRTYATLAVAGVLFSPVSQALLLTATSAACSATDLPSGLRPLIPLPVRWWSPLPWWCTSMRAIFVRLRQQGGLRKYLTFTSVQVLHDMVTRGRMQWVEKATDIGAVRPARPFWGCVVQEAVCGAVGNLLTLEYVRSAVGGAGRASWPYLALGTSAGAMRGAVVATGGQKKLLMSVFEWAEFLLELVSEREAAWLLGRHTRFFHYLMVVACGICSLLPWGVLIVPANRLVVNVFGEDPIVEQKAVLEQVAVELEQSQRCHAALASARQRAGDFFGSVELVSMWRSVKITRDACSMVRSGSLTKRAKTLQAHTAIINKIAAFHLPQLREKLRMDTGRFNLSHAMEVLEGSMAPIIVRRHSDLVRSALTQIAERTPDDLLMGITANLLPGLQDSPILKLLGLRVEFVGEEAIDEGGVRRDFLDSFAAALTQREELSSLALVEPLRLLGLGADSTWYPVPCNEECRGFLWALGRLLALALVHQCPCPVPLSLLVFKCLLGTPLRPGDLHQLDPDFWRHRIQPLLEPGGTEQRQEDLHSWGMDELTFTSVDGSRELCHGGASKVVTEENKEDYAQLLSEDFLIGEVRHEFGCLVTGFHEIVPQALLKELDAEQLRMLVCGVAELDVDEWQQHAKVEGSAEIVGWFFDWLRKQPPEARSKILAFTTGSSVLPCGWEGLQDPRGCKLPFHITVGGASEALPTAHTCANLLVLPQVGSRRMLERRLDQVVDVAGREMLIL